jgi:hypothetical protein
MAALRLFMPSLPQRFATAIGSKRYEKDAIQLGWQSGGNNKKASRSPGDAYFRVMAKTS